MGTPARSRRSGAAFAPARLLDVHSDADHGRSVYTLAAPQGELARALLYGAREAMVHIDLRGHEGIHPHVGAIDVVPVVYVDEERRGAACAEALTAAALIGEVLALPVFLYGQLATSEGRRERAAIRAGRPGPPGRADDGRRAASRLRPAPRSPRAGARCWSRRGRR